MLQPFAQILRHSAQLNALGSDRVHSIVSAAHKLRSNPLQFISPLKINLYKKYLKFSKHNTFIKKGTNQTGFLKLRSLLNELIDSDHGLAEFSHVVDGVKVHIKLGSQISKFALKLSQFQALIQFCVVTLPKVVKCPLSLFQLDQ